HGAFVLIVAICLGSVKPATLRGLGVANVFDGARENVFQLFPAVAVILVAVDAGQKQGGKTMAVHVAARFARMVRIANEPVAIGTAHASVHEPVGGTANLFGVLTFLDGA